MTTPIFARLESLKTALAGLPGVQTCRIGLEDNITPDDYPIIRIVPSQHQREGLALMKCEALIYFGAPIQAFDDVPDTDGRVRLEKLYASLFDMDAAIRSTVIAQRGTTLDTILDEDRLDTYKLMAVRCVLVA